jgi:protein involved in polysaccharide export with SLBB domain
MQGYWPAWIVGQVGVLTDMYLQMAIPTELTDGKRGKLKRRLGQFVALVAVVQLAVAPTAAQMLPDGRNSPSGSPLDSTRNSNSNGDDSRSDSSSRPVEAGDAAPDYRIEPVTVQGVDRPTTSISDRESLNARTKSPPPPNEFERFVLDATGKKLPRFGADLLLPSNRDYAVPATATVPPDYVMNVGDIVIISMTGSIEGSVEKEIDTNGRIFLPHVGPVQLAGVRYGDLKNTISRAIGTQYRGYAVNVGIRSLRGIRVYVTGFANNPGAYSINSLSTLSNAVLAAGGPSAGGSYRSIKLIRNDEVIREFDLYDFVLNGLKSGDAILQNQDVIQISPVGPEVAVTGSVNSEAIFEAKPGESLEQIIKYAGGTNSLADSSRLMLYRLSDFNKIGVREIGRSDASTMIARSGDIVQVLSEGTLIRPVEKQSVLVRIEGEVASPGSYYMPPNTPLEEVLQKAGGLTKRAFVFGTRFERTSVRRQQRESFNDAIQQLEVSLAAAPLTNGLNSDAAERGSQLAAAQAVLAKLRQAEPDGRVVLGIEPEASTLPGDLILENNDRIFVPPRPTTVGVFGAVYRPASFLLDPTKVTTVAEYLKRSGGPIKSGARGEIFVVRANGAVLAKRDGALKSRALPGDVIFVPVRTQSSSLWAKIREISTVIFQLGLSTAAFITVTK